MNRGLLAAILFGGAVLGVSAQRPAHFTGATILWLACSIALILLIARAPSERTAVLDIAKLATGSPVILNRTVGLDTKVHDAIFLGTTGHGATVQVAGALGTVVTIAHDDTKAWLEDPKTGRSYGRIDDDPVLATAAAELE